MHVVTLSLFLVLSPNAADSTEPATTPKGVPPLLITASIKDGSLLVTQLVYEPRVVRVKETVVNKEGKTVEVEKTVFQSVPVTREMKTDLKKATITTAGGKKMSLADAEKRLSKPAGVVLSGDGQAVDAGYLALLKSDTVVIVLPGGLGGGNIPVPPPPRPQPIPPPK